MKGQLEAEVKKRSKEQKQLVVQREEVKGERAALDQMRAEFENELQQARGEMQRAQDALQGKSQPLVTIQKSQWHWGNTSILVCQLHRAPSSQDCFNYAAVRGEVRSFTGRANRSVYSFSNDCTVYTWVQKWL